MIDVLNLNHVKWMIWRERLTSLKRICSWGMLFSHPNDFTPVCTTELGHLTKIHEEFTKRNVKLIGLSCNDVPSHISWQKDIQVSKKHDWRLIYSENNDFNSGCCWHHGREVPIPHYFRSVA